jgi:VanZ family protein
MNFPRFLKYWLPVLVWIAVIFIGSSDLMSAEHTSRLLVPLLLWLKRDITAEAIAQIHFLLRKCAHLTEYGILAIILWRAIDRGTDLTIKISMLYMSLFFAAALIAGADEFYQSFKPSRTASTGDVLIDIIGAMIGLAICFALGARKNLRKI